MIFNLMKKAKKYVNKSLPQPVVFLDPWFQKIICEELNVRPETKNKVTISKMYRDFGISRFSLFQPRSVSSPRMPSFGQISIF